MAELTHINEQGRAKMVDVSEKADTKRIGIASGRICMQPETFTLITDGKIKKGDVLVYNHDNKIIVHRVIKKSNNGETISFKTKGDYNNAKDSWTVKQEDVIGIVKFRIRWVGMPTVALNELLNK